MAVAEQCDKLRQLVTKGAAINTVTERAAETVQSGFVVHALMLEI